MPTSLDHPRMVEVRSKTSTTRLDVELIRKAGIIAACRQVSVAEYLKSVLEPIIDRDFKEEIDRQSRGANA